MRRIYNRLFIQKYFISLLFLFLGTIQLSAQKTKSDFAKQLESQPEISSVVSLDNNVFPEKYCVKIRQKVDWTGKTSDEFLERVFVGFKGYDRPTVIVTEGYSADYATWPSYEEELSRLFNCNLIVCEHRYFSESVPSNLNWDYLTVDNSLNDLHHVREIFGRLFHGKWLSTGISKGGQTTMFYRSLFPDDVDISVSYVAPLNKSVEDGRHEPFLYKTVGTSEERAALLEAQREILSRKARLLPKFEKLATSSGLTYQDDMSVIYDYCVYEFPFAFWQWGTSFSTIPSKEASDDEWFTYFMKISEPDYFTCPSNYTPFFVQAARELGYYGYSTRGLKDLCDVQKTHGYLSRLMLPQELQGIKFNKKLYKRTVKYLKKSDPRHLFIYGEIDPWSSSGVAPWLDCSKKQNMKVFVQPRGSHKARIGNMPANMRDEIISILTKWLSD